MLKVIKQVKRWKVLVEGQEHSGWLPKGAKTPLRTPDKNYVLDIEIVRNNGDGYLLIYKDNNTDAESDFWYADLAQAEKEAEEYFGIKAGDWEEAH